MGLLDSGTILELTGIGIPYYSARGLHQTLTSIKEASDTERDINGALVNLANPQFEKYMSKITCTDQTAPRMDGIWPGAEVTVSCCAELVYPVGNSPQREEVSGSSYTLNGFVFYRPILIMMVMGISNSFDEWGAENQWSIDLEEI